MVKHQASKSLIKSIANDDLKLEFRAAKRVQSNLAAVRNKLLEDLRQDPENWNANRLAPTLDAYLEVFEQQSVEGIDIPRHLKQGVNDGRLIIGEAANFPVSSNYWNWSPVIPINAISLLEAEATNKITKVSKQLKEEILGTVQRGLVFGATIGQLEAELLGVGLKGSMGRDGIFRSASVRAETIARTTSNELINKGALLTYNQANKELPELELEKVWQTLSDNRTSNICLSLAGQVKPLDKDFEGSGWTGESPPSHPNCRSRVTVLSQTYKADWESRFPTSESPNLIVPELSSGLPINLTGKPKAPQSSVEAERLKPKSNESLPKHTTHGVPSTKQTDEKLLEAINKLDNEQAALIKAFLDKSKIEVLFLPPDLVKGSEEFYDYVESFSENTKHYDPVKYGPYFKSKIAVKSFPDPRFNGFTWPNSEHLSVTQPRNSTTDKIKPSSIKLRTEYLFSMYERGRIPPSVTANFTLGSPEQVMSTYLHELGHQVRWKAGTKAISSNFKTLTKYADTNNDEWFAEHFAIWSMNPERYREVDPAGYGFVDSNIKRYLAN